MILLYSRSQLESAQTEIGQLRRRLHDADVAQRRCAKLQQAAAASEKENKSLKQTLKYLQQELVKSGKKM